VENRFSVAPSGTINVTMQSRTLSKSDQGKALMIYFGAGLAGVVLAAFLGYTIVEIVAGDEEDDHAR